jgi:hypothetical protein
MRLTSSRRRRRRRCCRLHGEENERACGDLCREPSCETGYFNARERMDMVGHSDWTDKNQQKPRWMEKAMLDEKWQ